MVVTIVDGRIKSIDAPEVVRLMTLKVLGRTSSINVRKVLWTCAELDLHFEHVESDPQLLAQQSQSPWCR